MVIVRKVFESGGQIGVMMNGGASAPRMAEGRAGGRRGRGSPPPQWGYGSITPRNVWKFYVQNGALWGKIAQF